MISSSVVALLVILGALAFVGGLFSIFAFRDRPRVWQVALSWAGAITLMAAVVLSAFTTPAPVPDYVASTCDCASTEEPTTECICIRLREKE